MSSRVRRLQVFATTYSSSLVATCWKTWWVDVWERTRSRCLVNQVSHDLCPMNIFWPPACRACWGRSTQRGRRGWGWSLWKREDWDCLIRLPIATYIYANNGDLSLQWCKWNQFITRGGGEEGCPSFAGRAGQVLGQEKNYTWEKMSSLI